MTQQDRLREYWYYSDEKIKRLASQIRPPGWRRALDRIAAFEVKAMDSGGRIETRERQLEAEMLQLLQNVWKRLERQKAVGTFEEPERFVYGQLEFYYGAPYNEVDPPAFFLAGVTDGTVIGLGGSLQHVRGYRDHDVIAAENAKKATMEPDVAAFIHNSEVDPFPDAPAGTAPGGSSPDWARHVAGIYWSWESRKAQKLEFEVLAAKEGASAVSMPFWDSPRQVIIGSPIFVAFT